MVFRANEVGSVIDGCHKEANKMGVVRSGFSKWLLLVTLFIMTGCAPTLNIIVGFAPGGAFDFYSRAIARHMGKHVSSNPTIQVYNMTGDASLIAANYFYKRVKPDGLTIGTFHGRLIMQQLLRGPGIEFDARRFEYIGVPAKDNVVCALTKSSGITSIEKWVASRTPVRLGGVGAPGISTDDVPKILKATIGLPIELVSGYKGTTAIRQAAEKGEVAGGCWAWESIRATWREALESGQVNIVLQGVPKPLPELPNVPLAINFAKTEEARNLIQRGIHDKNAITRLYVLPPGTPKEQEQILRRAFMDTMKDPEFLAEVKKLKLDIDPLSGEEVESIVAGLFKLDAAVVAKLKDILK